MKRLAQFYRRHLDPNRMTSEVAELGGHHWRVTHQRGKVVGIERWVVIPDSTGSYGYTLWKKERGLSRG